MEAGKWDQKAADQGNVEAQDNLGAMYREGEGVNQDHKEAVRWFRKAAEQGNVVGQIALAGIYFKGKVLEQNSVTAFAWINIAATNGQVGEQIKWQQMKDLINKKMTPAQKAKAEALVKEMVKKNPKLINK